MTKPRPKPMTIGTSVEGRPLERWRFPAPGRETHLILAGVHGDEPKSVFVARRLIEWLSDPAHGEYDNRAGLVIVPLVNPDGYQRRKRRNARGVDINRNFPTENWTEQPRRSRMYGGAVPRSEPETQAIMNVVARCRPDRIVTIHSISGGRHCNNYDGPGRSLAVRMSRINGYPVTASIGYPTPGSFGTWAGVQRGIPTITLELPSCDSPKRCWEDNRLALLIQVRG